MIAVGIDSYITSPANCGAMLIKTLGRVGWGGGVGVGWGVLRLQIDRCISLRSVSVSTPTIHYFRVEFENGLLVILINIL